MGVLAAVLEGTLSFGDLVSGVDTHGTYQGGRGRPAFTPSVPVRGVFPALPAADAALLVRTEFGDEAGWRALLVSLGGVDEDSWIGADGAADEPPGGGYPLRALVVDDPVFDGLAPGQVPALVPPGKHTPLVTLADVRTFTEPGRPLTAVDLYDAPGHIAVLPARMAGSMACNLEISNMDFHSYVLEDGTEPWWDN